MPHPEPLRVSSHTSVSQTLITSWSTLLQESESARVFQTPQWFMAWQTHLAKNTKVLIVTFHSKELLVGMAALQVGNYHSLPLPCVSFAASGVSDYLGIVIKTGYEKEVYAAFFTHLPHIEQRKFFHFQQLPSAILEHLPVLGVNTTISRQDTTPQITLPKSWEEYSKTHKKLTDNIRYAERRLLREHTYVQIESIQNGDAVSTTMTALYHLHSKRWKSRGLPGVLGNTSIQAFHHQVAQSFAQQGWLRMHRIVNDGITIAALYGYSFNGRYYYYLAGFDPAYYVYSPGALLISKAIQEAITEECHIFDFLRGEEGYKKMWADTEVPHNSQVIIGPSLIRKALVAEQQGKRRVEKWLDTKYIGLFAKRRGK